MAIFDIFKKKKKKEKKIKKEKPKKKEEKIRQAAEGEKIIKKKVEKKVVEKPLKKEVKIAPLVLRSPHIAEKSTRLIEIDKYVFKVYQRANKTEIKKAIEEIYGVNVLKVNIIKIPRKKRRLGKTQGWRKGYKKAIVKIKKGQKIEILPR